MSVSKRTYPIGWLIVTSLGLLAGGCDEPPVITAEAPPGVDPRAMILEKRKAKEEPEALGETVNLKSNAEAKKAALPGIEPALPTAKGEVKTTKSGVKYETLKEGTGAVAKAGQKVVLHYTGTLDDGRKFDSSHDRGKPFTFVIGVGEVVKGWDEAIPGMKIGEVRRLIIPPSAGYGALGAGGGKVPPNAELHFDVELLDVQ